MASVTVNYNFQTFRTRLTASTNLNEVLKQSKSYFRLADTSASDSTDWTLLHNGKKITMDLPWRLLNLPAGCKFDLCPIESRNSNEDSDANIDREGSEPLKGKTIKIRFQTSSCGSTVRTVSTREQVLTVLETICKEENWSVPSLEGVQLRILSSVYDYDTLLDRNFAALGITESTSVMMEFPKHVMKTTTSPEDSTSEEAKDSIPNSKAINAHAHKLHVPKAYIPSETTSVQKDLYQEEEEDYELNVEQARRYQNILSQQAGNLGGPLMTRKMREDKEKEKALSIRKRITECLIRIKFPDRTFLEMSFKPTETMSTVYEEVTKNLIDRSLQYKLFQPHPHQYLPPTTTETLTDDLGFGLKSVVLLETDDLTKEGPFLKDTVLRDAKPIMETLQEDGTPKSHETDKIIAKNSNPQTESTKVKKIQNKVPKWLKLSKK